MSPCATNLGFDHARHLMPAHQRASAVAGFSIVEQAPWVYSALSDLWELEQNGQFIPGLGDMRIGVHTASRGRRLLSRIGNISELPSPVVAAFSGGGISMRWRLGQREVTYTFWPEGVLTYSKEENGETLAEDELPAEDSTFDPREPMEWLFNR